MQPIHIQLLEIDRFSWLHQPWTLNTEWGISSKHRQVWHKTKYNIIIDQSLKTLSIILLLEYYSSVYRPSICLPNLFRMMDLWSSTEKKFSILISWIVDVVFVCLFVFLILLIFLILFHFYRLSSSLGKYLDNLHEWNIYSELIIWQAVEFCLKITFPLIFFKGSL